MLYFKYNLWRKNMKYLQIESIATENAKTEVLMKIGQIVQLVVIAILITALVIGNVIVF